MINHTNSSLERDTAPSRWLSTQLRDPYYEARGSVSCSTRFRHEKIAVVIKSRGHFTRFESRHNFFRPSFSSHTSEVHSRGRAPPRVPGRAPSFWWADTVDSKIKYVLIMSTAVNLFSFIAFLFQARVETSAMLRIWRPNVSYIVKFNSSN